MRCGRTSRSIASCRRCSSRDALAFKSAFPGKTAYAVKTNGEPMVLKTLAEAGIDCFDVASPGRVRRRPGGRAEGRALLHAPGQGAVRHPPRARDLRHPHHGPRPRGRGRQDPQDRARARSRSRGDHAPRPARLPRPCGLRAVEEVRRGARRTPSSWSSASTGSASRSGSASMSAARSRTPTPTSGRSPPPPGCGRAPASRSPCSTSAAASRRNTAMTRGRRRRRRRTRPR